jgi:hypothetical protein
MTDDLAAGPLPNECRCRGYCQECSQRHPASPFETDQGTGTVVANRTALYPLIDVMLVAGMIVLLAAIV